MKKAIALGIISLTLATAASAQVKPEDQIKFRQAGYSFMSWNMGKIKANLEGEYNAQQVQAAVDLIQGLGYEVATPAEARRFVDERRSAQQAA